MSPDTCFILGGFVTSGKHFSFTSLICGPGIVMFLSRVCVEKEMREYVGERF